MSLYFDDEVLFLRNWVAKNQIYKKTLCVFMTGPLGAGKTTFTQEFLLSYEYKENVQSPTFLKVLEYQVPELGQVLHLDCYRIEDVEGVLRLSLESYSNSRLWLIEWPQIFKQTLTQNPELRSLWGIAPVALSLDISVDKNGLRRSAFAEREICEK